MGQLKMPLRALSQPGDVLHRDLLGGLRGRGGGDDQIVDDPIMVGAVLKTTLHALRTECGLGMSSGVESIHLLTIGHCSRCLRI
jgi:hypothetical protein